MQKYEKERKEQNFIVENFDCHLSKRSFGPRERKKNADESVGNCCVLSDSMSSEMRLCFHSAVFAHYQKRQKTARKTSNLETKQGVSANVTRDVCNRNTLRLKFRAVVSTEFPLEKVCKNTKKHPFLPSEVVNSEF